MYGEMKTYKTKKTSLINEIFIMQDLSPRKDTYTEVKIPRKCGVSKMNEQEEYQKRKQIRAQFNNVNSRPMTQQGNKVSRGGSRNIISKQNF